MGGALEARGIPADRGKLVSEARGQIGLEGDVLVVRSIHVTYHLKLADGNQEIAQRVHEMHVEHCPVARTIQRCVNITTALEMEEN